MNRLASPGHLTPIGAELKRRAVARGVAVCDVDLEGLRPTLADFEHAQTSIDMGATPYTTRAQVVACLAMYRARL